MPKVILIHGNGGGSGQDSWFPYMQRELEQLGVRCDAPDFPEPEIAPAKLWLPYLEELGANSDTILVGHSTGAIAAMRYAETHQLHGSILVAAYHTDLGYPEERAAGYFDTPWDWEAIKRNQQWIVQFASIDDPYIPIEESHLVRDYLRTEYHEFVEQGHFGGSPDNPKLEFPELLEILKRKLTL
jgi:uncharacterized protein